MRVLKVILLTLDAIIMLCVGAFIGAVIVVPSERSFTNEVYIDAPADVVWNVIDDREQFPDWQPGLKQVDVEDSEHWVEYSVSSPEPLRFSIVDDERPSALTIEYAMGDSFTGNWRGGITPLENGVRLKTRDSYKTQGYFSKVFIAAFFNMDRFAKTWNENLKRRAESLAQ